jgi:hypothetical protein
MRQFVLLIVILIFAAGVYYLLTLPPREIKLKDIHPVQYRAVNQPDSSVMESPSPDSTGENAEDKTDEAVNTAVFNNTMDSIPPETVEPDLTTTKTSDASFVPVMVKTASSGKMAGDYYIIIESIQNPSLAAEKAEILRKKLNAEIYVLPPTPEGNCRISYGRYNTMDAARSAAAEVRANIRSDAWILRAKN